MKDFIWPKFMRPIEKAIWLISWGLIILTFAIVFASAAKAQELLVPAYSPAVARQVIAAPGGGTVILNPNSGPGEKVDNAWAAVFKQTSSWKKIVYVDLLAWPKDGIVRVDKMRVKTVDELNRERELYRTLYGHIDGWFFDDATPRADGLLSFLVQWPGTRILNPGTKSAVRPGFVSIVHESPGFLKAWLPMDPNERAQCGAMALDLPGADLDQARAKAKGLRYFYAHNLGDDWRSGQTAFFSLPKYWGKLIKP